MEQTPDKKVERAIQSPQLFLERQDLLEELNLEKCVPFDTVEVHTANTVYCLMLIEPRMGHVVLENSMLFPAGVEAVILGSRVERSGLSLGRLKVGQKMEFWANDRHISTSPIHSIYVEHTQVTSLQLAT